MSIIVTPASGDAITYADTGDYETKGQWLEGEENSIKLSGRTYSMDFPRAAGNDGAGSKDFGFDFQTIEFDVIYVDNSEAALLVTAMGHLDNWPNQPSTVNYAGYNLKRAFLDAGASFLGKIKDNAMPTTKYYAKAHLKFTARGL